MHLRLVDLRDVYRLGRSYGPRHCEFPGCSDATREGKPFCSAHVESSPYVVSLLGITSERKEQDEKVADRGARKSDVDSSISVHEILQNLNLHGPRTEERLVREVCLELKILRGYLARLSKLGLVLLGRTKRGSTVAKITRRGLDHLSDMRLARPTGSAPAEPTCAPSSAPKMLVATEPKVSRTPEPPEPPEPPKPPEQPPAIQLEPDSTPKASAQESPVQNLSGADARLPRTDHATAPHLAPRRRTTIGRGVTMKQWNGEAKRALAELSRALGEREKAFHELAKACLDAGDMTYLNSAISAEFSGAKSTAMVLRTLARSLRAKRNSPTVTVKRPTTKTAKRAPKKTKVVNRTRVAHDGVPGWIKNTREALGLSQVSFALKINASRTQVWHWEKGNRPPDDVFISKIEKLAGKPCPTREETPAVAGA